MNKSTKIMFITTYILCISEITLLCIFKDRMKDDFIIKLIFIVFFNGLLLLFLKLNEIRRIKFERELNILLIKEANYTREINNLINYENKRHEK